jgi:hypothetical protein
MNRAAPVRAGAATVAGTEAQAFERLRIALRTWLPGLCFLLTR